jgi:enoyl-CoA hydratase/carnithine racemase
MSSGVEEIATVEVDEQSHVALVRFNRPPVNYFDEEMIRAIADAYDAAERSPACRAIVLASTGRHFCAGADFVGRSHSGEDLRGLYAQAARLFEGRLPVVAAVQGRAVGGGLGLALSADFRVATPETRFVCSFARLGLHHGFGMTVTLPRVVGEQRALELLCTGGEVRGEEALAIGLCDRLAVTSDLEREATELAAGIAAAAPLAVQAIRRTLRGSLAGEVSRATAIEVEEQERLTATADFAEGVRAATERRSPSFSGN